MEEIGIWPRFTGRGIHDRLASYDAYDCAHSICGALLVRDCAVVAQQEQQEWAAEMQDFLLDLHDACQEWRLLHLNSGRWLCRSTTATRLSWAKGCDIVKGEQSSPPIPMKERVYFRDGAASGAPGALQIADGWHILRAACGADRGPAQVYVNVSAGGLPRVACGGVGISRCG